MGGAQKIILLIAILIPVLIAYNVRLSGADMPQADSWARSTVYSYYSNQLKAQVDAQYPNLPESSKRQQIDEQMRKLVPTPQVQQQVAQFAKQVRDNYRYQDDKYYYMPDIDPYEYLAEAQEIIDHGHIGDVKKTDGYWYQMNSLAPTGQKIYVQDLHPVMIAYWHKLLSIFKPGIPLMQSSMYVPAVFASLATIFVFLIVRVFAGNTGGFFAALLYGVHPLILNRTLYGHADTDIWQVLLIPMVLCFATLMLKSEGKKRYVYGALAGLVMGLFSFSWSQWYVTFDVLMGCLAIFFALTFIWFMRKNSATMAETWKQNKGLAYVILVFVLSSGVFVSLLGVGGWKSFFDAPFVVFSNFAIKESAYSTLWPNVYTTVAELAPVDLNGVMANVGKLWLGLAGLGLAMVLWKKEWFVAALIVLFSLTATVSALVAGVRFTMFMVLPVSIGVGLALGYLHKFSTEWVSKAI